MKKLIAFLGSLLLFLGLKAQTNSSVSKETTPLEKPNVQNVSKSATQTNLKNSIHKQAMLKENGSSTKMTKVMQKKTAVTLKQNNVH
jgi:hypothetical protein